MVIDKRKDKTDMNNLARIENYKQDDAKGAQVGWLDNTELFRTPDGNAFASFKVDGHQETWALKSRGFMDWLYMRLYEIEGKVPSSQKLRDTLGVLAGKALYEGIVRQVHIRLAEHEGEVYLDLADEAWRIARISHNGWQVVESQDSPVRFRRVRGMLPLPTPEHGGSINELRSFVNLRDDEDWVLLITWMAAALRPRGPYPVLALHGEQGSAKSTTARLLCSLIDPNAAALRSEPRGERDLMIAATNKWLVTFDNLSRIKDWLSDSLCRIATGSGFATRELRTDDEEMIFNAQRPIILNGIDEVATRNDLLDRSLILYFPTISEENRKVEEEMMKNFALVRPRILGALLEAVSAGLRNIDTVRLDKHPRLADFAKWGVAVESGLGLTAGTFMDAYTSNRAAANDLALDTSPIGVAVLDFMEKHQEWETTAGELLTELNMTVSDATRKQKGWPKTPKGMGDSLRRVTTNLRAAGVVVQFGKRQSRKRLIYMERAKDSSSLASPTSLSMELAVPEVSVSDDDLAFVGSASPPSSSLNAPNQGLSDDDDAGDDAINALDDYDEWGERAAILELDGLPTEEANHLAIRHVGPSLSTFVRVQGGMRAGNSGLDGELRRLSNKETGSSRLVNNLSGNSIEDTMNSANEEGYREKGGDMFDHPGNFLRAVELDATKIVRYYHPDTELVEMG
jgi:hypothetical protein